MAKTDLIIFETIFKSLGYLSAFIGTIFAFLEVIRNDDNDPTRKWFRDKWDILSNMKILTLSEDLISSFLNRFDQFYESLWKKASSLRTNPNSFILGMISLLIISFIHFISWIFIIILIAAIIVSIRLIWIHRLFKEGKKHIDYPASFVFNSQFQIYRPIITVASLTILVSLFIFKTPIITAFIVVLIGSPFISTGLYYIIEKLALLFDSFTGLGILKDYGKRSGYGGVMKPSKLDDKLIVDYVFLFLISMGISLVLTFLFLTIGHYFEPDAFLPQYFQMIISNLLFDGLTVIFTIAFLRWSLKGSFIFRFPLALLGDVLFASIFAVLSLYFGLIYSVNKLSIGEIIPLLVGFNVFKNNYSLGPYFWLLHSTFLPSIIYLSILFAGWVGKVFIEPINWFFGKTAQNKRPFAMVTGLCSVISGFLFVISFVFEQLIKIIEIII